MVRDAPKLRKFGDSWTAGCEFFFFSHSQYRQRLAAVLIFLGKGAIFRQEFAIADP